MADMGVIWVEAALLLLLFFLGMILPTSTTLALQLERDNSGSASAVLGFLTFLFGGVFSPLAGLGNMIVSTSVIMVLCGACTLVLNRCVPYTAVGAGQPESSVAV